MEAKIVKRGRPPGKSRRGLKKWQPTKWEPLYEQMVALSVMGKSNVEIAEMFNYNKQQVSNILTCDKAIAIKLEIIKGIRSNLLDGTIQERLNQIKDKTVALTHKLLNNEALFEKNPFSVINTALAVNRSLEPNLQIPASSRNQNSEPDKLVQQGSVINNIIISPENAKNISDGLEKLKEVKILNAK